MYGRWVKLTAMMLIICFAAYLYGLQLHRITDETINGCRDYLLDTNAEQDISEDSYYWIECASENPWSTRSTAYRTRTDASAFIGYSAITGFSLLALLLLISIIRWLITGRMPISRK